MNRFERRKRAIEKEMLDRVDAYKAIYKKADTEDRDPSDDERLEIESHVKALEVLREEKAEVEANLKTLQDVEETGRRIGHAEPLVAPEPPRVKAGGDRQDRMIKSLGELFTESEGYKSALEAITKSDGRLPQGFSTGAVSLSGKGTLLSGGGSGTGGALAQPVPQLIPGVTETLFQRLTVADVLGSGQATTSSVRYVVEGTATSGAAGVAEAGVKPESTLGLSTRDEPIKKIATILPISEEMLEDAPQVQSYINGRLTLFVRIEEERQLLRGTSGGNEVQGLLTGRGVPVYAGGTAAGNKAEQVFKAINGTRGSAFVEPEFIIMHPSDYQDIRLAKDANNQLYGGGPFFPQYGGSGFAGTGQSQVTGATDSLWMKPVVVTAAIGAGTAVAGTREAATVWRRGGLSVEASNSHSDYFQRNLVAIRAEERLGLAVYRPAGFVEIRLS